MSEGVDERLLVEAEDFQNANDPGIEYDDFLDTAEVSSRQILAVIVCGLGNATDQGVLSGSVFIGMLVGAVVAGLLADTKGRKPVLAASMALNFVFTLAFSFSNGIVVMSILRFLTGCGVGAAVPVVFSLASEVVPSRRRGAAISVVASFWMIGSILVAVLAWAIIPHIGWRPFVAACSVPAFLCMTMCLYFVKESPRFLLRAGKSQDATEAAIYLVGKEGMLLGHATLDYNGPVHERTSLQQLTELVSPRLRRVTVLLCIITAGISFGWYGLLMWMPLLFEKRKVNLCWNPSDQRECTYESALFAAFSNIPGNLVSVLVMDRVSRKGLMSLSCLFSALAAYLAYQAQQPWELGLAFCMFNAVSVIVWNCLDVISTESFPTALRGTSMGLLSSLGRIAATGSQMMHALPAFSPPSPNPILAAAAALAVSCIASLLLPETLGIAMVEM